MIPLQAAVIGVEGGAVHPGHPWTNHSLGHWERPEAGATWSLPQLAMQYGVAVYDELQEWANRTTHLHRAGSVAPERDAGLLAATSLTFSPPTLDEFTRAVLACGFPLPVDSVYHDFLRAAHPDHFVAESTGYKLRSQIGTRRELAMFLAQILHESDGLRARREYICVSNGCPGSYVTPGLDVPGRSYYGRG